MEKSQNNTWNGQQTENTPSHRNTPTAVVLTPVEQLHDEIDRLFGDVFSGFMSPWGVFPRLVARDETGKRLSQMEAFTPRLDLMADEKAYTATVEVPGVDPEQINIEVRDNALVIHGEKKNDITDEKKGYYRRERSYGSFQRVLSLPEDADIEGIKASNKDGVLSITIPRKEPEKPTTKKIEISKE